MASWLGFAERSLSMAAKSRLQRDIANVNHAKRKQKQRLNNNGEIAAKNVLAKTAVGQRSHKTVNRGSSKPIPSLLRQAEEGIRVAKRRWVQKALINPAKNCTCKTPNQVSKSEIS